MLYPTIMKIFVVPADRPEWSAMNNILGHGEKIQSNGEFITAKHNNLNIL